MPHSRWCWPRPNTSSRNEASHVCTPPHQHPRRIAPRLSAPQQSLVHGSGGRSVGADAFGHGRRRRPDGRRLQGPGLRVSARRQRQLEHPGALRQHAPRAVPGPAQQHRLHARSAGGQCADACGRQHRRACLCPGPQPGHRPAATVPARAHGRAAQRGHPGAAHHARAVHGTLGAASAQAVLAQRPAVVLAGIGRRGRHHRLGRAHGRPVHVGQQHLNLHLHQRDGQRGVPVGQHRHSLPGHPQRGGAGQWHQEPPVRLG